MTNVKCSADMSIEPNQQDLHTKSSYASVVSRGTAQTEDAPLLSQEVYDEMVVVHKMHGRPSLPLPLVIAHRLQLYFASEHTES